MPCDRLQVSSAVPARSDSYTPGRPRRRTKPAIAPTPPPKARALRDRPRWPTGWQPPVHPPALQPVRRYQHPCFLRLDGELACEVGTQPADEPTSGVKATARDQRSNIFALSVKVRTSSRRFPGNTSTFSFRLAITSASRTPCTPRMCGGSSMGSPLLLNEA